MLYTAGPEKLVIGKFCAIATGATFLMSSANHPMMARQPSRSSSSAEPGSKDREVSPRDPQPRLAWWNWPVDVITEHVRTIWTGTPAELEQEVKNAGLPA